MLDIYRLLEDGDRELHQITFDPDYFKEFLVRLLEREAERLAHEKDMESQPDSMRYLNLVNQILEDPVDYSVYKNDVPRGLAAALIVFRPGPNSLLEESLPALYAASEDMVAAEKTVFEVDSDFRAMGYLDEGRLECADTWADDLLEHLGPVLLTEVSAQPDEDRVVQHTISIHGVEHDIWVMYLVEGRG